MNRLFPLFALLLLAACGTPTPLPPPPTLAQLPTALPSPIPPTHTPAPIAALPSDAPTSAPPTGAPATDAPATDAPADASPTPETPLASILLATAIRLTEDALTASAPPTLTPLVYLSPTPETQTATVTPSLTITATITPTPSDTFTPSPTVTPSPDVGALGLLALASDEITFLPPALRIPPPTLTIWAQTARAPSPTPPASPTPLSSFTCPYPPPPGLSLMLTADPALLPALGCPLGAPPVPVQVGGAWQFFERGVMVYLSGSPGQIYALTSDGRFRRFDDLFLSGINPESGGEIPPAGLLEPVRGFGKVWRENPDLRASLGWGVVPETGGMLALQRFERGQAVGLLARGETLILVDDPAAAGFFGAWRALPGVF